MPKQKITIHLDSEIAEKLRLQSIEKYHNARSMSRLIEDLATDASSTDTGLTPEEVAVLDRADNEPVPEEIKASMKLAGTSCCGIWDKFYKCPDCLVKFEMFGSSFAPVVCPQCKSKRLRVH
jgi:hypothetical protein